MASEYCSMPSSPLPVNPNPSVDSATSPRDGTKLIKASAQLNRWSRARAVRSGRRLDRPPSLKEDGSRPSSECSPRSESGGFQDFMTSEEEEEMAASESAAAAKAIYMVSDGTGSTLEHAVNSALGQFEQCLSDRACSVNIHLFSGIEDVERLLDVIKHAAKDAGLLLYTLANPSMSEAAKQACQTWGIPHVDILRPTTDAIASHLGVAPSGIPRSERRVPLSKEYFKRIEAIEFTIKQDDGALPQNLHLADIVLVGVSRSGKTPLSIYLAQKGYKVANVPIVMGVELPKTLFQVDQEKIFALSINPAVLQTIRKTRAKALGSNSELGGSYSEMDHVRHELEHAYNIYAKNPLWPVQEVTGKAIEELAAVVLRIYHDRKQKNSMPNISRRY